MYPNKNDEIVELFKRVYSSPGYNEEKGIQMEHFATWSYCGEIKIVLLESLKEALPPSILKRVLEDIRKVLESSKNYFLEASSGNTSYDVFSISIVEIISRFNDPIEWIERELNQISLEEGTDTRIGGLLSPDEVRSYFMELTRFYNAKGKGPIEILKPTEVDHLLKANFQGFFPIVGKKWFQTDGINKTELRKFVYRFYERHSQQAKTGPYISFLIDNFIHFKDSKFNSLQSNFSK